MKITFIMIAFVLLGCHKTVQHPPILKDTERKEAKPAKVDTIEVKQSTPLI